MAKIETADEQGGAAEQLELPGLNAPTAEERTAWLRHELDLVTDADFARAINVAPQTLAVWRCDGMGPDYLKLGKAVFYRRAEIRRWLDERLSSVLQAAGNNGVKKGV